MDARITKVARVSATFSKSLDKRRFSPVERDAKGPAGVVVMCALSAQDPGLA
jgi:hypothetical protein